MTPRWAITRAGEACKKAAQSDAMTGQGLQHQAKILRFPFLAGLNLLLELLVMFESSNVATQFYQTYYMQLINEIFAVMTGEPRPDTLLDLLLTDHCPFSKPAEQPWGTLLAFQSRGKLLDNCWPVAVCCLRHVLGQPDGGCKVYLSDIA